MRIQSITSQPFYNSNRNNQVAKSNSVMQNLNPTFNGDYAQAFKTALKMPIYKQMQVYDIFDMIIKAVKTERVVNSQAFRRFKDYNYGNFIVNASKSQNLIVAEPVEMGKKPFIEIEDGVVVCHSPNTSENITFYYNKSSNRYAFQRITLNHDHSVHKEQFVFWPNGRIEKKVTSDIWNGGSSTETEYFNEDGKKTTFWGNIFGY